MAALPAMLHHVAIAEQCSVHLYSSTVTQTRCDSATIVMRQDHRETVPSPVVQSLLRETSIGSGPFKWISCPKWHAESCANHNVKMWTGLRPWPSCLHNYSASARPLRLQAWFTPMQCAFDQLLQSLLWCIFAHALLMHFPHFFMRLAFLCFFWANL